MRRWSFFILALIVSAVCVRLGIWQLERLQERKTRNASIISRLEQPFLELDRDTIATPDLTYRRVTASGSFDPVHEIVLQTRSFNGLPGVHLVTPLRLEGLGVAVLVNRGWIPDEASQRPERRRYSIDGVVTIHGLALPSQESSTFFLLADPAPLPGAPPREAWRVLSIDAIQSQIPYPLLPVYIAQSEPLAGSADQPIPISAIDLTEGPHLGYAIQWFSFAAIALLGGAYWIYRTNPSS